MGDHLSKGILNCSEMLLGIVGDLFEVSLALEETASGLFDITLAQEEDCPRVPDRAEASRLFICLLSRNKYFGTFYSVWSTNEPTGRLSRSDLTIGYRQFSAV